MPDAITMPEAASKDGASTPRQEDKLLEEGASREASRQEDKLLEEGASRELEIAGAGGQASRCKWVALASLLASLSLAFVVLGISAYLHPSALLGSIGRIGGLAPPRVCTGKGPDTCNPEASRQRLEKELGPCAPSASFAQYNCNRGDWQCFGIDPSTCGSSTVGIFPRRKPESQMRNADLSFNSCALIGASTIMNGAGHGPEIDKHDTVIRVNRLPSEEFYKDFGSKTSVYFVNLLIARAGWSVLMGGSQVNCSKAGTAGCDFEMVVLKALKPTRDEWDLSLRYWDGTSPFPTGVQLEWIAEAATALPYYWGKFYPSTGFLAFLTFAPLCKHLTLYGFGGATTAADGHPMTGSHNITLDNMYIDYISDGTMSEWWDWMQFYNNPPPASKKLQEVFTGVKLNVTVVRKPAARTVSARGESPA